MNIINEEDLDEICAVCGYENGVHHAQTNQCPGDDPYMPADGIRKWANTHFEHKEE